MYWWDITVSGDVGWRKNVETFVDLASSFPGNDQFFPQMKCFSQKCEENFLIHKLYSMHSVHFVFKFCIFTMNKRSSYLTKFKLKVISYAEKQFNGCWFFPNQWTTSSRMVEKQKYYTWYALGKKSKERQRMQNFLLWKTPLIHGWQISADMGLL